MVYMHMPVNLILQNNLSQVIKSPEGPQHGENYTPDTGTRNTEEARSGISEIRSSLTHPLLKGIRLLFHIHANRNDGNCGGT